MFSLSSIFKFLYYKLHMHKPRVLFILKKRNNCWGQEDGYSSCGHFSSGLYNSANFVNLMLQENGIESKIVEVFDGHCVDKEVYNFKPTCVIVEAIWCPPYKFEVLTKLHPKVKWIIRNHSEVPFLSNEGNGFNWMLEYTKYKNVYISNNSLNIQCDFIKLVSIQQKISTQEAAEKVVYFPNYYPIINHKIRNFINHDGPIKISCFCSVRPLKNQMIQAIAAIEFAESINKKLHFHINGTRVEGNGEPILKNLRLLFSHYPQHKLIEHNWKPHAEFLKLIGEMDISMQVSFSETFNIVAADSIKMGIPIVVSDEIIWAERGIVNCNNTSSIVSELRKTWDNPYGNVGANRESLREFCETSKKIWLSFLKIK
jgi:hypothetical protein